MDGDLIRHRRIRRGGACPARGRIVRCSSRRRRPYGVVVGRSFESLRTRRFPALSFVVDGLADERQDGLGHSYGFFHVRVAGEDELVDSKSPVGH